MTLFLPSQIEYYKNQMDDIEKSWQQRLELTRKEMEEMVRREKEAEEEEKKIPHLSNLNEDPALSGKLCHVLKGKTISVGNAKDGIKADITLNGPR